MVSCWDLPRDHLEVRGLSQGARLGSHNGQRFVSGNDLPRVCARARLSFLPCAGIWQ
jgi:hypothetical protein